MALTTENILHSFSLQSIFGERERESKRVRERKKTELQSSPTIVGEPRAPVRVDLANSSPTTAIHRRGALRDRDRCFARSRSMLREIAPSIAISRRRSQSRLREIAPSIAVVGLELAKHRAVEPIRASIVDDFFSGFFLSFVRVFLGLSFPSSFPNTRKFFSENFLKCNQTHENIFLSGK